MPEGNQPPAGILSLTYHLVHEDYYTNLWLDKQYDAVFDTFQISAAVRKKLLAVNDAIGGSMTKEQAEKLVDAWLAALRDELTPATQTLW
jgi:hypothetical protein